QRQDVVDSGQLFVPFIRQEHLKAIACCRVGMVRKTLADLVDKPAELRRLKHEGVPVGLLNGPHATSYVCALAWCGVPRELHFFMLCVAWVARFHATPVLQQVCRSTARDPPFCPHYPASPFPAWLSISRWDSPLRSARILDPHHAHA